MDKLEKAGLFFLFLFFVGIALAVFGWGLMVFLLAFRMAFGGEIC